MLARLSIGLLLFACHALALTTVSDNLFKADGTPCTGSLAISWVAGPTTIPGTINIPVGVQSPGNFIAQLQPGTYSVVFNLQSGCSMTKQTWMICNTTFTLNMQQAVSGTCLLGSFSSPEAGAIWTIPGSTHGLGCAIMAFPYDSAGNLMNWPSINVAPSTCTVTVRFASSITGTLALVGSGQTFPFTAATTASVTAGQHGIQAPGILIAAYDVSGNLLDGSSVVNPTSFLITDSFGSPQTGNLIVIGAGATFPFASTLVATVTQAQHGFTTAILFPASLDLSGNLLDPLININASTFQVTSTFGASTSGRTVVVQ